MSASPKAVIQVSYQAFPQLGTPFIDEFGQVSKPWYMLLVSMFAKLGGSQSTIANSAFIQQQPTGSGAPLGVYAGGTGAQIGVVQLTDLPGGAAVPLAPAASPFIYTALAQGTLIVFSAKVEISRDTGANWLPVSLNGGAIPLLKNDQIRLTWFSADPPEVTFLPSS